MSATMFVLVFPGLLIAVTVYALNTKMGADNLTRCN